MPGAAADALKARVDDDRDNHAAAAVRRFRQIDRADQSTRIGYDDAILPLLIFTLVFAFAITRLPAEPRSQLSRFFSAIADAMIIVIDWVLRLAPIGVFALAFVVGARSGYRGARRPVPLRRVPSRASASSSD